MAVYLGQDLVEQNGGQPVTPSIVNETITVEPKGQQQIIIPDQGYTGIGRVYVDPVQLTSISIRPDARLIRTWKYDRYAVADENVTLPTTYSTSEFLLKDTYYVDNVDMDWFNKTYALCTRMLVIPEYSTDVIAAGRQDYFFYTNLSEFTVIPANTFKKYAIEDSYGTSIGTNSTNSNYRLFYFTNSTDQNSALSTSYGARGVMVNPSWSTLDAYLKPSAPSFKLTGHSSYLNQTYYEALTDIRLQYVIDLYEAPKGNLNHDGLSLYQGNLHIADDIINNNWTLT